MWISGFTTTRRARNCSIEPTTQGIALLDSILQQYRAIYVLYEQPEKNRIFGRFYHFIDMFSRWNLKKTFFSKSVVSPFWKNLFGVSSTEPIDEMLKPAKNPCFSQLCIQRVNSMLLVQYGLKQSNSLRFWLDRRIPCAASRCKAWDPHMVICSDLIEANRLAVALSMLN